MDHWRPYLPRGESLRPLFSFSLSLSLFQTRTNTLTRTHARTFFSLPKRCTNWNDWPFCCGSKVPTRRRVRLSASCTTNGRTLFSLFSLSECSTWLTRIMARWLWVRMRGGGEDEFSSEEATHSGNIGLFFNSQLFFFFPSSSLVSTLYWWGYGLLLFLLTDTVIMEAIIFELVSLYLFLLVFNRFSHTRS